MKYSMLSAAAFVASSLASPAYFWEESSKPGAITVTNNMNIPVRLNPVTGKYIDDEFEDEASTVIIPQGHSYTIQSPPPRADLELSELRAREGQVEVKYQSEGREFKYEIKRIKHGGFPGVVHVRPTPGTPPHQCRPPTLTLFPPHAHVGPAKCRANTKLQVVLCRPTDADCPPRHPYAEYEAEWL